MGSDGNGVDMGVLSTMLMQVLETAEATRRDIGNIDRRVGRLETDFTNLRGEVANLRGEVANLRGEVTNLRGEVTNLRGEVANLRADVRDYHGAVMGHGILYSQIESRVSRIENQLGLPPEPH